jgi:hypothetical protein
MQKIPVDRLLRNWLPGWNRKPHAPEARSWGFAALFILHLDGLSYRIGNLDPNFLQAGIAASTSGRNGGSRPGVAPVHQPWDRNTNGAAHHDASYRKRLSLSFFSFEAKMRAMADPGGGQENLRSRGAVQTSLKSF